MSGISHCFITVNTGSNRGVKKFIAQLPLEACSRDDIAAWQKSEILRLQDFYKEVIEAGLPRVVEEQIDSAIAFIRDGKKIDTTQAEYIGRVQEMNLLSAANKNNFAKVKCLLKFVSPDVISTSGETALYIALAKGHDGDIATLLIAASTDVDKASHDEGQTPLHIASNFGYVGAATRLIDAGADVNKANFEGMTSLLLASQKGHVVVVKQLIAAGAVLNTVSNEGVTALIVASQNGHVVVVKHLIAAGADVNTVSNEGVTALVVASQNGHLVVVKQLIAAGAYMSIEYAFLVSAYRGHKQIVEELLSSGADVNQANDGVTIVEILACQGKHPDVVQLLIENNATIDDTSKSCIHQYMPQLDSLVAGKLQDHSEEL